MLDKVNNACSSVVMCSMANLIAFDALNKMVCSLDRPALLRALGLQSYSQPVGDFPGVRALDVDLESGRTTHKSLTIFLGEGVEACCKGAKLCRYNFGNPMLRDGVSRRSTGLCTLL